jgi:hypothetical protein
LRAPLKGKVETIITKDVLRIELPESFSDFYHLENSVTSLSLIGDSAIITVEATVIPVEVPPEYPEISTYGSQFVRIEEKTIEKTIITHKTLVLEIGKEGEAEGQVEFEKDSIMNVIEAPIKVENIDASGTRLISKPIEV